MALVVAIAALSGLGRGRAAYAIADPGQRAPCAIQRDFELAAANISRPFASRIASAHFFEKCGDPALRLLDLALDDLPLSSLLPFRCGLALGTSSGAMSAFVRREAGEFTPDGDHPYASPFRHVCQRLNHLKRTRSAHVLSACSASTMAIGLASHWIATDQCDIVIAGGYDALTVFVAAGFCALGAIATQLPRPLATDRDGMALGEGVCLLLLTSISAARKLSLSPIANISGFGFASDAIHLTAPDPKGTGAARSLEQAMVMATCSPDQVSFVSLHGTSTQFNDAMEDQAVRRVLGSYASHVPVHVGKASIGHTFGAAGALETAMAIDALENGVIPATAGYTDADPTFQIHALAHSRKASVETILKTSSAFGGANAALVLRKASRLPVDDLEVVAKQKRVAEPHWVQAYSETVWPQSVEQLESSTGLPRARLLRMDRFCHIALSLTADISKQVKPGTLQGAALVLFSLHASLETNLRYASSLRLLGAQRVEARRFAYTTPQAAVFECAQAFGLTGANIAVTDVIQADDSPTIADDLLACGTLCCVELHIFTSPVTASTRSWGRLIGLK